jgi:hypothetical protein
MNWFHFWEEVQFQVGIVAAVLCLLLMVPAFHCWAFDIVLWGRVKYVRNCYMCGIIIIGHGHRLFERRRR